MYTESFEIPKVPLRKRERDRGTMMNDRHHPGERFGADGRDFASQKNLRLLSVMSDYDKNVCETDSFRMDFCMVSD